MNLFKSEWLYEPAGRTPLEEHAPGRYGRRYGVQCEARTRFPEPARVVQVRRERVALRELARRDRPVRAAGA